MIGADIRNTTSRTSSTARIRALFLALITTTEQTLRFIRFDSSTTVTELQLGGTADNRGATAILSIRCYYYCNSI
jgi:hypothetical protein